MPTTLLGSRLRLAVSMCVIAGLCAASLGARSARAQSAQLVSGGADAHLFRPAVDSKGYISTNGSSVLGAGDYSFGLVLDMGIGILPFESFEYDERARVTFDADGQGESGFETTDRLIDTALTGT